MEEYGVADTESLINGEPSPAAREAGARAARRALTFTDQVDHLPCISSDYQLNLGGILRALRHVLREHCGRLEPVAAAHVRFAHQLERHMPSGWWRPHLRRPPQCTHQIGIRTPIEICRGTRTRSAEWTEAFVRGRVTPTVDDTPTLRRTGGWHSIAIALGGAAVACAAVGCAAVGSAAVTCAAIRRSAVAVLAVLAVAVRAIAQEQLRFLRRFLDRRRLLIAHHQLRLIRSLLGNRYCRCLGCSAPARALTSAS